jgi:amino acid adenylation domain-containing protein
MPAMNKELIDGFPLSAQQRRIWLAQQDGHVPPAQCAILLDGPLDTSALHRALSAVVTRHDILRTSFRRIQGLAFPVQVVCPAAALAWKQIECGERGVDDLWAAEGSNCVLDPPALRACLARICSTRHTLIVTLSALCADIRTFFNLFAELATEYEEAGGGRTHATGPATLQYLQFSAWQDSLLGRDDAEDGLEFWRRRASEASTAVMRFPFETVGDAPKSVRIRSYRLELGSAITRRVRALARENNVSEEAVLLAAWQEVLRRWTGAPSHTMWVAVSGREHVALAPVFGPISTLVPVSSQRSQSADFLSDVMLASDAILSAREWSMFYRPDHDGTAMCSRIWSSFNYTKAADDQCVLGVTFSMGRAVHAAEKVDASLVCIAGADSVGLDLQYSSDRIAPAYAQAAVHALSSFIEHVDGRQVTSQVKISPVTRGAPATVDEIMPEPPRSGLLHRLFEEQVERTPDRTAVVYAREELTFAQLNERANRLANYLLGLGAEPENPIAVCLGRSSDMIVAILGILKSGAPYLPIDPGYPAKRIRYILHETNVSVVLAHTRLLEVLPPSGSRIVCLDADLGLEESAASNPDAPCDPDNLAYVIYTSGSTGSPKGVMVSHRSAANLLKALRHRLYGSVAAPRRVAMNAPIVFDASIKQWIQLLDGNTLCIVPEHARLKPDDLAAFVRDQSVDVLDCTPSQLRVLVRCRAFQETPAARCVLVGGEDIDAQLWSLLASDSRRVYFNVYGPTEGTVDATAAQVDAAQQPAIGHPLINIRVHVLDSMLEEQPVGFPGELYIGGAGVARGYRNRPDHTADRFVPDPFSSIPGARLYRTGDLVCRLADGQLRFLGRADGQVKLRGHRIEISEIESVLKQADCVRDAVVAVRGDEQEGQKRLVAYVIPQAGTTVLGDELRVHLRHHLPDYMIPSVFASLPAFPLTTNGKVDVHALPEPGEEPDRAPQNHAPPTNKNERIIARIWQDVLGTKKIGIHDNFFDVGGHSLLMVQVYMRLREVFDREISMVELFRNPTIALLSRYFSGTAEQSDAAGRAADRAARRIEAVAQAPTHRGRRSE